MTQERLVYAPVLSEKANALREANRQFVFRVHPTATKRAIRDALERQFGVKVDKVAIINTKEKPKRNRRYRTIYKPGWKKAIVKLKPGKTFDFFEGV